MTDDRQSITLDDARRMIAAGEEKAKEIGVPYNIAVVDSGGNLVAHERMDGAWIGSIDIAVNKAWTARAFDMSTKKLADMAQSGESLFGIHVTNDARVVVFPGGEPCKSGKAIIGAIGASGGDVTQDQTVVDAAVAAL